MGRPKNPERRRKYQITLPLSMAEWLEGQMSPAGRWYNMSHALETAVQVMQDRDAILQELARVKNALAEAEAILKEYRTTLRRGFPPSSVASPHPVPS